ncbi:MAG: peptidoglycan-associated lipoprotein Pal [Desulfobulbaceae bacterium]|nr:peptidoglycan-associated lipoprotein Pal [Desulfobulbaceae bacterium]
MVVLLFASISACAKKPVAKVEQEDVAKVEEASPVAVEVSEPQETGEAKGGPESLDTQIVAEADPLEVEARTSAGLFPLYFDFDKSIIRSDQVERVEKNADFLKNNPDVRVRIEGNCDERGTNEYNMALGQRRALSGQQYLVNLGVAKSRFDTISYGEERSINFGHDELSWSQNRRDDFVITK